MSSLAWPFVALCGIAATVYLVRLLALSGAARAELTGRLDALGISTAQLDQARGQGLERLSDRLTRLENAIQPARRLG